MHYVNEHTIVYIITHKTSMFYVILRIISMTVPFEAVLKD
jgi:hypothetical protein